MHHITIQIQEKYNTKIITFEVFTYFKYAVM